MKGVCFDEVGRVSWRELDDPIVESPQDAIVQIELAGLCGSDLHPFFGREKGLDPGTVMGHEFVGTIVEVGKQVSKHRVGDRVYAPFSTNCGECFYCVRGLTSRCPLGQLFGWRSQGNGLHGGQAEFVRVPLADGTLLKVPGSVSAESALLLGDNFSTGYFCAEMAQVTSDSFVVVVGCGTVGLLATRIAIAMGAKQVIALDRVDQRRKVAETLGAKAIAPGEEALDYVMQQTEGRGADCVLELVGLLDAQEMAFRLLRPGGVLSVIGCHTAEHFAFSPSHAYDKNLTYRTGRCPARHYMDRLTDEIASGKWSIDSMITHRFRPEECVRAYDVFAHQRDGCLKAVLEIR